jgi:hypothetical protein
MALSATQAQVEPALPDLTTGFGVGEIQPLMLDKHLTLNEVFPEEQRGTTASWDQWRSHLRKEALAGWEVFMKSGDEFTQEDLDAYFLPRLLYGTAALPQTVLDACHTMLFGGATPEPSIGALKAMAAALFPHRTEAFWLREMYRKAAGLHEQYQRQVDQLNALLAVLED